MNAVHEHDIAVSETGRFSFSPQLRNRREDGRRHENEDEHDSHGEVEKNLLLKETGEIGRISDHDVAG